MTKKSKQGLCEPPMSGGGGSEGKKDLKRAPASATCTLPPPNNEKPTTSDEISITLPCAYNASPFPVREMASGGDPLSHLLNTLLTSSEDMSIYLIASLHGTEFADAVAKEFNLSV